MKKTNKNKKDAVLNENTLRRWSTLAGTRLTENKINEYGFGLAEEEDEELEVEENPMGDDLTPEGEPEMDMSSDEMSKNDFDSEGEAPGMDVPEEVVQDLVSQIAGVISDVTGVPVEVEGAGGEMSMDDLDNEEESVPEDEPLEDEPLEDEPLEDEPLEDEPLEEEKDEKDEEEEVVEAKRKFKNLNSKMINEIARRVSERVLRGSKPKATPAKKRLVKK